ncbi:polymorphic toxin-type HINT domain-containing protein [Streptomyces sp. NPDC000348]|uniref:polymorphic toxin-type HINT domain-containing protein n=1 Tax=Streptomyces sp. NPDC000348 TaxID=3364538 RepID=UPI0036C132FB
MTIPTSEGALAGTYLTSTAYNVDGSVRTTGFPAAGLPAHTVAHTYEEGTQRLATSRVDRQDVPGVDRHHTYGYDQAGNVLSVPDVSRSGTDTQCFAYDHLRRMKTAWTQATATCAAAPSAQTVGGPAPYWHSYTYDKVGNRETETLHDLSGDLVKNTVRTCDYPDPGTPRPHALSSVTQTGPGGTARDSYGYDAVGNTDTRTLAGTTQDLDWDAEGRLVKVTKPVEGKPDDVTEYVYDASGNRLIARTGLLGKGAKVVFRGFKAAFKKGDSVPIECLVGGGRHSSTPGTLVLMADGSTKPIEDVRIGDEIVVTDPETGRTTIRKIVATIDTEDDKHFVDLPVSRKGARAAESLTTTTTHPFWSPSEGAWLYAGELGPGMTLRTADGGTAGVTKTHEYRRLQRTHDLTVDGIHTYYVLAGETPVLVHNAGGFLTRGSKDLLSFGSNYTGRVDRFDIGGTSDLEIHVYHRGKEIGIFGSDGWFSEHGKSADVVVPNDVYNNLKGLAVGELRRDGRIGPKGTENIKGDGWKRPRITGGC